MGHRILLDSYLEANFGDDLLISVLCKRYPAHEFFLMCDEGYLERFGDLPNLHAVGPVSSPRASLLNRVRDKARLLLGLPRKKFGDLIGSSSFDMYLLFGGSLFIERKSITERGRRAELRSAARTARVSGIMNCSFGPYTSDGFLNSYREVLAHMDFLSFRDAASFELFRDLSVAAYGADLSLSLAENPAKSTDPLGRRDNTLMAIFPVLLTPRGALSEYEEQYSRVVEDLARRHLEDPRKQVVLVPSCVSEGDVTACRNLASRLEDHSSQVCVLSPDSLTDVLDVLERAAVIIGSRFHSICLGIARGIPTYALSYSNKIDNMLADLGLDDHCVDIKDLGSVRAEDIEPVIPDADSFERMTTCENQFRQFEYGLSLIGK